MSGPDKGVDVFTLDKIREAIDQMGDDAATFGQGAVLIIDEASDLTPERVQYLLALHAPTGEMLVRPGDTPTSPSIYETRYPDPWAEAADRFYPPRMAMKDWSSKPVARIRPPRKNKAQRKARKIMRRSK